MKQTWKLLPRGLRVAGAVLLALLASSVAVFQFGLNLSFVDALYFVVTTVTTVGYGDVTPLHAGVALKLYACLLMVLGSLATAALVSLGTDLPGERPPAQRVSHAAFPQRGGRGSRWARQPGLPRF